MPAILTPALALRYLHELSTDLRAAVVLAADGELLAGDAAAAAPARELAAALDGAGDGARELLVRVEDGGRLRGFALIARVSARTHTGARTHGEALAHTSPSGQMDPPMLLAIATGPHVLLPLLRLDVAVVLEGLGPASAGAPAEAVAPSAVPSPVAAIGADGRPRALQPADFAGRTAIFAGTGLLASGASPAAERR